MNSNWNVLEGKNMDQWHEVWLKVCEQAPTILEIEVQQLNQIFDCLFLAVWLVLCLCLYLYSRRSFQVEFQVELKLNVPPKEQLPLPLQLWYLLCIKQLLVHHLESTRQISHFQLEFILNWKLTRCQFEFYFWDVHMDKFVPKWRICVWWGQQST